MSSDMNGLFRLKKEHIKQASAMFARAFFDDPETSYFFPDPEKRARQLGYLFPCYMQHGIRYGEVYATSPAMEGAAVWLPSDRLDISSWQMLIHGGLQAMFRINPVTLRNLNRSDDFLFDTHKRIARYPHMYLAVLGVDPEHQGKGFSSKLVRPMLERLDREGIPAYLETQTEKNVAIYQRFGFEVIKQVVTPVAKTNTWIMVRGKTGATD